MSHSWVEEFEQRLQRLEQSIAVGQTVLSDVVELAVAAMSSLSENSITEIWIVQPECVYRLTEGNMHLVAPGQEGHFKHLADSPTQWVDHSALPLFTDGHCEANSSTHSSLDILIVRYPLAHSQEIIVGTRGTQLNGSRSDVEDATLAVTTMIAARVTQHLLSAATKSANALKALLQFAKKLQACDDDVSVHQVIAQESGNIWPHCRIATMEFDGSKHRIKSVTGVGQINHQSIQVQAIALLAETLVGSSSQKEPEAADDLKWTSLDDLENLPRPSSDNTEMVQLIADYKTTGVTHIGMAKIHCKLTHVGTVLLESNENQLTELFAESRWHNSQWIGSIQSAINRTHCRHPSRKRWKRVPWPITFGIVALLTALSFLIPMEFELTTTGQLVARGRRSVFAPESGTVTAVHFINEQKVDIATPLITLANPELMQRASELDGEVATTKAALAAVNARRTSRAAEGLAAEGQVLKQRLKSLEAERKLIDERIKSLLIRAPFPGYIVRRDAIQDLTDRPLQRGQRIAELIPLEVNWGLELHIPQSQFTYLQAGLTSQNNRLPLRYIINSEPGTTHSATLESIEQFTYIRNNSLVQNAAVNVQLSDTSNAKSGTSVSARISCGQRSLGFVATRKLLEFVQHLKFVWWN